MFHSMKMIFSYCFTLGLAITFYQIPGQLYSYFRRLRTYKISPDPSEKYHLTYCEVLGSPQFDGIINLFTFWIRLIHRSDQLIFKDRMFTGVYNINCLIISSVE